MYKIKLFRNMSGLVAGQSLKQMITNRDWWKGVFGNILSTMIGIGLTIGVGALVEYHNNKKLAREMMFHVLMTTENNIEALDLIENIDSMQIAAGNKWINWYVQTNGNLTSLVDSVPVDTLNKHLDHLFLYSNVSLTRSKTENYFYSPQMMHQFGNPQLYADFALFVQKDLETFEMISDFNKQCTKMYRKYRSYGVIHYKEKYNGLIALEELIGSGEYIDFLANVGTFKAKKTIEEYKEYVKKLLKEMGATQKEYDEYKKEHNEDLNSDDSDDEKDKKEDTKVKDQKQQKSNKQK